MCFSATASFASSAIILTLGIVSIKKATTFPQKILACIPFIFAVQQFSEGVLWLSLDNGQPSALTRSAYYIFLVFAEVAWPIMLPLSIMLLEKEKLKRQILKATLITGILIGLVFLYCLVFYKVEAVISCYHIVYNVSYPIHTPYFGILYLVASFVPPIISSIKKIRLLGVILIVSYAVTEFFYEDYLISVWCFFAAVISIIVLLVIIQLNRADNPPAGIATR